MADRTPVASEILGTEGWVRSACLRLLDFDVAVHSNDPEVPALIHDLFEPLIVAGEAPHALVMGAAGPTARPQYFVAADEGIVVRSPASTVAFAHLMFEMNQRAIAQSTSAIRVHAAAAVLGGGAVVLPGPMGAGKSTLVAGLVQRGLSYVTDEVVAIDPVSHRVLPYPRPCSLGVPPAALAASTWSPSDAAQRYLGGSGFVPATRLGAVTVGPVPIRGVVLPKYVNGASTTLTPLGEADALVGVASHTFDIGVPGTLSALAASLTGVPAFALVSGDLDAAVDAVLGVDDWGTS